MKRIIAIGLAIAFGGALALPRRLPAQSLEELKQEKLKRSKAPSGPLVVPNNALWDERIHPQGGAAATQEVPIILFFPRDGWQNPGGQAPNWYYYWVNGNVVASLSNFKYVSDNSFAAYFPGDDHFEIYDLAPTQNDGPNNVTNKNTHAVVSIGANGKGLHCCAESIVHEQNHQTTYKRLVSSGDPDTDGDGLTDNDEQNFYAAYNFDIHDPDTYNLAGSINATYASYGDDEFLCRLKEKSPGAANDGADWSDTNGANWGGGAAPPAAPVIPPALANAATTSRLAPFLSQKNSATVLAAIGKLGQIHDPAALPALMARFNLEPYHGGGDGRAPVRTAIVEAIRAIGGAQAKAALLDILKTYRDRGPECACQACKGKGLYPWHDSEYIYVLGGTLNALGDWIGGQDVSDLLLQLAMDDKQVKSGPLRQTAYEVWLRGEIAKSGRSPVDYLVDQLTASGIVSPAGSFTVEDGVGRFNFAAVQSRAAKRILEDADEAETVRLQQQRSLLSPQDPQRKAAIDFALGAIKAGAGQRQRRGQPKSISK